MRILIIEDEEPAADKLEKLIRRHSDEHEVLDKIRSVEDAVAWFEAHDPPDVLFLDIHLLDGACFDILKRTRIECPVIFTTAYDSYALEAFQLHSIDYLLKPISFARLRQAFEKLEAMQQTLQPAQQTRKLTELLDELKAPGPRYKSRFLVKSGARLFSIGVERIRYFFSEESITFLVVEDGKKYAVDHTLDELEELLAPADFFRVNRQMILHIDSIQMVHKYFKGRLKVDVTPPAEQKVMVSSRRVADFQAWLDR